MYIISGKQLFGTVAVCAIFIALLSALSVVAIDYFDRPKVFVNDENKCVKVVNFKNGDGFTCQDKDITLRNYRTATIQASAPEQPK